jgi:lysophospholipase L1-like esterase
MARTKNGISDYWLIAAAAVASWMLASMVFGQGGGEDKQLPSPESDSEKFSLAGQRVLLIGSSSAVGFGSYLKTLLGQYGVTEFKNIGKSGTFLSQWSDNSKEMGRKLETTLAEFQPTVVFIFVGSNDECGGGSGTRAAAVERLHGKLQGTRSFFIGLPTHTVWKMNRPFRDLLASTWEDDYFNTESFDLARAGDRYHLSPAGYRTLAAALDQWISSKIE